MSYFFDSMRCACAIAVALIVAGCTSVPQASEARDADAKQFNTQPGYAAIYVYRPDFGYASDPAESVLWMDTRLIGSTLPRTFFRLDTRPGRHVLHGDAHDTGKLALDTKAGELYFVSLNVVGGISRFTQVSPDTGRREILKCCAMMENWAPGQRPLLR
jgi:hypothetical protein